MSQVAFEAGGAHEQPISEPPVEPRRKRRIGRVLRNIFLGLAVILIAFRLALPEIVKRYVNRTLDKIPEYDGSIDDVDIALIRGAYTIRGLKLVRTTGKVREPFVSASAVDLSVQWGALFQGKWVGEIELSHGSLNFVRGPSTTQSQTHIDDEWLEAVKDLFPLRLNRFALEDVAVTYSDTASDPPLKVKLVGVKLEGRNFSNTRKPVRGEVATIDGSGLVEGRAPARVRASVQPGAKEATFDLRASVVKLPLTSLNDLFRAYGNFDVQKGSGEFYVSLDVKNNELSGRLKPIIRDIEVFDFDEEHDNLLQAFWEAAVGTASEIFENHRNDQIATVVPLSGSLESVDSDRWRSFIGILRNAFLKAVKPGWDEK